MHIATVVGHVWATQKDASLTGVRLLVVQPFTADGKLSAETMVAADTIGAGIGERVLVVFGRAARHAIGRGRQRRALVGRGGLVPIRRRIPVIRAVIGVAVLHRHLEALREGNGRIRMKTIDHPLRAAVIAAVLRVAGALVRKRRIGEAER